MIALWKMVVKRALHYVVGRVVDLIDENCQEDTVSQIQFVLENQTSTACKSSLLLIVKPTFFMTLPSYINLLRSKVHKTKSFLSVLI